MSNLDNIKAKIVSEFEEKEDFLKSEAQNKKENLKSEFDFKLSLEKSNLDKKYEADKKLLFETLASSLQLKCKNILLEKKQELITSILNELTDNLENISNEELKEYILNILNKRSLNEDEKILVSKKYENLKEVINNLEIIENLNSGFVIKYSGIEENYTFKALINYSKENIEECIQKYLK